MDVLYVNNDSVVEVQELRDDQGVLISGADVTATLYEADGVTEVPGMTWPASLVYTGANGTYAAELSDQLAIQAGRRYRLKLTASFLNKKLEVERTVQARARYE